MNQFNDDTFMEGYVSSCTNFSDHLRATGGMDYHFASARALEAFCLDVDAERFSEWFPRFNMSYEWLYDLYPDSFFSPKLTQALSDCGCFMFLKQPTTRKINPIDNIYARVPFNLGTGYIVFDAEGEKATFEATITISTDTFGEETAWFSSVEMPVKGEDSFPINEVMKDFLICHGLEKIEVNLAVHPETGGSSDDITIMLGKDGTNIAIDDETGFHVGSRLFILSEL